MTFFTAGKVFPDGNGCGSDPKGEAGYADVGDREAGSGDTRETHREKFHELTASTGTVIY